MEHNLIGRGRYTGRTVMHGLEIGDEASLGSLFQNSDCTDDLKSLPSCNVTPCALVDEQQVGVEFHCEADRGHFAGIQP